MRRDVNDVLSHPAYYLPYPWDTYASLLCSQYIILSILCSDILHPSTMLPPLEPYQAPREDSQDSWGDEAKSIHPVGHGCDRGERDVCGQAGGVRHQTSDSRTKGDPQ